MAESGIVFEMTALLDLPEVRERVHRMSVEEYHRAGETGVFGKDVELLQGIVVTKMSKSPLHETVADKLMDLLLDLVPREFQVRRDGPLTLRESEPEPDVSVVKGTRDDWAESHPSTAQLVVEVAITSETLDESKGEIYAEAGIPEYWLVRPIDRQLDVYREPARDGYLSKQTLGEDEVVRCQSIPNVQFTLSQVLPRRR